MAAWPKVEAMPHSIEVLSELRLQSVLAVATNAADSEEAEIWAALSRVGLDKLLDNVYCYRKIGHKKPSKEFFEYILADLGVQQPRVIMVGDDFEADVVGANTCGIRAVWYNPRTDEKHESPMHRTVHDLRSLSQTLDSFR
jgi:putative hydrolase of the HAD superfamily